MSSGPSSRRIVATLVSAGYDVSYHEFGGGHVVAVAMQRAAAEWLDDEPPIAARE